MDYRFHDISADVRTLNLTAWCRDNLGRRKRAWDTQNGVICIRSPRQATAFKLRWC